MEIYQDYDYMDKKIKRFILRDDCDSQWDDLIEFEEYVNLQDIYDAIQYVKDNIEDYTNEDIYDALDKLGKYRIEFIGQLLHVLY